MNHEHLAQGKNELDVSARNSAQYSNSSMTLHEEAPDIAPDILAEMNRVLVQSQGHFPRAEPEAPSETLLRAKSWTKDLMRLSVPAHLVEYLYLSARDTRRTDPEKRSFPPSLDDLIAEWVQYRVELHHVNEIERTRRMVEDTKQREIEARKPAAPGSAKEAFIKKFGGKAVANG